MWNTMYVGFVIILWRVESNFESIMKDSPLPLELLIYDLYSDRYSGFLRVIV